MTQDNLQAGTPDTTDTTDRLAVCSWSLQPASPEELIEKLHTIGIKRVQLHLNPLFGNPEWQAAPQLLKQAGIEVVSGMLTMVGEDYTTLETIKETGGILPDDNWHHNWTILTSGAYVANELGIQLVTFHAGFIPSLEQVKVDLDQKKIHNTMVNRLKHVCKLYERHKLTLGLETGQETADDLLHLLSELGSQNLGVNFDPANMILYAKGDPIEALSKLKPHVIQLHVKDATYTQTPGTWGSEVAVSEGEVDWDNFLNLVQEIMETSKDKVLDLAIEREAGDKRIADIKRAASYIRELLAKKTEVNA